MGYAKPEFLVGRLIDDPSGMLHPPVPSRLESQLERFEEKSGIRVIMEIHPLSPTEAEDSQPGSYMRALAAKLGVLADGVLIVYFVDEDDWRVWIGNELTPRFVGRPGTAEEFTKNGAMHEAKEAWLADVFAESDRSWTLLRQVTDNHPMPSDRLRLQAEALANGIEAKFSPVQSQPIQDLLSAMPRNDRDAVNVLLHQGNTLELRDPKGRTPLMIATQANQIELVDILVEAGADVNARDALQDTPYLFAGAEGRWEILKLTLAHGADLKSTNRFGGTALIPAAEKGHLANVVELLQTELDINHVNNLGWTALYEAVMRPRQGSETYRAIVQALLDAGADVTIADKQGRTPAQRAHEVGNDDLAGLITAAGKPKVAP